jgi:predicted ATPase
MPLLVRIGLHSGLGTLGGDDYVGIDVNRAARIAGAAHGGQVLVSDATRALVQGHLPVGVTLRRLGEYRLRDLPEPELLHQVLADGLPADFAPPNAIDVVGRGNLPTRLTTFIGRARDLAELDELLRTNRLLTLVGPGGTGKTSLAVELARREAERFEDGAWFFSLEAVTDPELVASVLAAGFGLVAGGSASVESRLVGFLAARSLLLVIDNFEHLLDAAPLLPDLLRAAPRLTIVVTSRAPLRVEGEQAYSVPPLALPGAADDAASSDALRLFEDRAARVRPGYRLVPAELEAVAEICRRLDGLPLGIEIAASRMAVLPARDIADRLARRLDLPGGGFRDAPLRQRTLQAAIAWSFDLLSDPERRLLERLSVFAGSFGLDEAELVCRSADELGLDVLGGISTLVEHSLVQPVASPRGARFRLLTTIRMTAADRLVERGESATMSRRHAEAYLALAESFAPQFPGRGQGSLLDRLSEEHDNLRAAIDWAVATPDAEVALRLAGALWRYWQGRGHLDEGAAELARILAIPGASAPTRARLRALDAAGGVAWWQGDVAAADASYIEQVRLARHIGDPRELALALSNLSHTRLVEGAADDGAALRAEAIRLFEETGDARGAARVEWIAANQLMQSDPAASRTTLEHLLRRFVGLGDDFYVAMAAGSLSWALVSLGEYDGALDLAAQSLRLAIEMDDVGAGTVEIHEVEVLFALVGRVREAAILDGAFDAATDSPPRPHSSNSLGARGVAR